MKIQAALFKNSRKSSTRQPDYIGSGDFMTDENQRVGEKSAVELAGWAKTAKTSGKQYLSMIIKWKNEDAPQGLGEIKVEVEKKEEEAPVENPLKKDNEDDQLPF